MIKNLILILVVCVFGHQSFAQTKAHERSKKYIIDPAYQSSGNLPVKQEVVGAKWLYGYAELQCWRLQQLRKDVDEAKLKVGYPGEYHQPYSKASFIYTVKKPVTVKNLIFYTNATAKVKINGKPVKLIQRGKQEQTITLTAPIEASQIEFELSTTAEPPCLLIKDGPFNTSNNIWKWNAENEPLQVPEQFSQLKNGAFPHQYVAVETDVNATKLRSSVFDFGRELLAYVYLESKDHPSICVGESLAEANQTITDKSLEQTMELIPISAGKWRSKVPLAFRYVKVTSGTTKSIYAGALFHPAQYRGAFASSDTLLNRIWMNSAYTLRLCRNEFLNDGIKRDRLPWAGDLAMSMMVNAFTFGDAEPVKNSLAVLNRAGIKKQDINGIIDYDLWWLISENQYQLYYKDIEHLNRQWPRIKETMEILKTKCDSLGMINVKNTKWLFIDWVKVNKTSTLQVLWWWAQQSAVELAKRVGDGNAAKIWQASAMDLKKDLTQRAWNENEGSWMDDPYTPKNFSRHANILAVISGLSGESKYEQIGSILRSKSAPAVGTPYMSGFEALALAKTGNLNSSIQALTDIWGGMLKVPGTTTFWEAYSPRETAAKMYSFYSRPFGKSLCHAWSSGPAAVLPTVLLGLRPLTDGWKTFEISPKLGSISWLSSAIPTPQGTITVDISDGIMNLTVPKNCIAYWGDQKFIGPLTITKKL